MTVEEWLGEGNQIGIDIWNKKYRRNGEDFEQWLDRVSGGNQDVRKLMKEKKFLFGGRILSNRGVAEENEKNTYSNCYVIDPPSDSIESIYDTCKKLARTYSYGGGCGIDISKLAPAGAVVHNQAKKTSGAVSFMDTFSQVTEQIGQNGRRGALMISMSCTHPDIEKFITVKSDLKKVNYANISVMVSDDFMEAVENDDDWELQFDRPETNEKIRKTVKAKELFDLLCKQNWDYAEPGILFWDTISEYNLLNTNHHFKYAGVNPCFSGNMQLLTPDGYKSFEELCDTEPYIVNVNGNCVQSKVWCSGKKETVKIKTRNTEIICTPDHKFMTIDGNECMAKDLKGKDLMPVTICNRVHIPRFIKYGFIQGDGQLSRLSKEYHEGIEVNIGYKDTDIRDLFNNESFTEKSDRAIYLNGYKDDLIKLGFCPKNLPEREFPTTYKDWTFEEKASFLHGCYSANGSVIKNGRISYKTSCRKFADQLADTLLYDFGIEGVYITTNKPKVVSFKNGDYECRESYDINIGRFKEITKFATLINFYQQYKREQLAQMLRNRPVHVYNVEPNGLCKVYDFTEPERHWGIVEGCIVHNCAEEPLPAGGSCLLGSLNLSEFVNDGSFNYEEFSKAISVVVGAMNEVLDEGLLKHPLEEQRKCVAKWRQIGIGIMGLADALIKMKIKYGSSEAVYVCNKIGAVMASWAIDASAELAGEYGAYTEYDDRVLQSKFFKAHRHLIPDETVDIIQSYGLRNSQILTIAPTGTLSTMLGISGGIEPIFANSYTRMTKSLHGEDYEYKVYTPIVAKYMEQHGITDEANLPDYFVTSGTIPVKERVAMQAVWQKHIDASISSTVNLPHEATVEDVADIYMAAWKAGLKGITVFREGCARTSILTSTKEQEREKKTASMSDTKNLDVIGLEHHLTTGCGSLHICAYFDKEGNLKNTYLSKGSSGGCNNFMIGLSRVISLAARNGVCLDDIVDQLKSCGTCPSYAVRRATKHDVSPGSCCPVAIANGLLEMRDKFCGGNIAKAVPETKQIEHKVIVNEEGKCPECGGVLKHEMGCVTCVDCGYSKCN